MSLAHFSVNGSGLTLVQPWPQARVKGQENVLALAQTCLSIWISYLFLITTLFPHHLMYIALDSHQSSHLPIRTFA